MPRKKGMERADLLNINAGVFTDQGKHIGANANPNCKVLVVGNPCNTNALICRHAGDLPRENVFAMTMLDENRAYTQIAQKAGVDVTEVKNLTSGAITPPPCTRTSHNGTVSGRPITEAISDHAWLEGEFLNTVQKRGAAIIEARGSSSAASAANGVVDTVQALTNPTPEGESFSVAVVSTAATTCRKGCCSATEFAATAATGPVVQGIEHGDFGRSKLAITIKELEGERDAVSSLLV